MPAYVLLNFIDDVGRSRVAKIPFGLYKDLMRSAEQFEMSQRGRRSTFREEPSWERPWYMPPKTGEDYGFSRGRPEPDKTNLGDWEKQFGDAAAALYDGVFGPGAWKREQARQQNKREQYRRAYSQNWFQDTKGTFDSDDAHRALFRLAGVEYPENHPTLDDIKGALRKAKRKCHPDTGGSNELWLTLEKIAKQLRLKF